MEPSKLDYYLSVLRTALELHDDDAIQRAYKKLSVYFGISKKDADILLKGE